MSTLVRNVPCGCCGKVHLFCDPDRSSRSVSGTYTFTCPENGKYVTTRFIAAAEASAECPKEAVLLKRVTTFGDR